MILNNDKTASPGRTRAAMAMFLAAAFLTAARAAGFPVGWRPPETIVRWPGSSGDGYAGTSYKNREYVADVATTHEGAQSYSVIRFSTNRSGRWERSLVAKIKDDPDTGGQTLPQIAVMPVSGRVVIVVSHPKSGGDGELLTYANVSGAWTAVSAPKVGQGPDSYRAASLPSLAAAGSEAVLAFNASSPDSDCSAQAGYIYLARLEDGAGAWSPAKNVTADYCGPKGGFAKAPILALSGGGIFLAYHCAGDPNGSPGAMCLRSGDLGAASEEVVESNTPDWGMSVPGVYALSVADGAPVLAYVMNQNNQLRLMLARKSGKGWTRSQLAAGGARQTGQVLSLPPALLIGSSGPEVAYAGYATYPLGGNNSQAIFLTREASKPWNFTRSKFSDASPEMSSSGGFGHLFLERDGQSVLWSREEPLARIRGEVRVEAARAKFSGTVEPASSPEKLRVCLEHKENKTPSGRAKWKARDCRDESTHPAGGRADVAEVWPGLAPGRYRARIQARLTDDHLAGDGAWREFVVKKGTEVAR